MFCYNNFERSGPRDVPYPSVFGKCSKKPPINIVSAKTSLSVAKEESNFKLVELLMVSMLNISCLVGIFQGKSLWRNTYNASFNRVFFT
jgi:hypothetical protein